MRGPEQGGRTKAEDENGDTQRNSGEQETKTGEHCWGRFRLRKPLLAKALEPNGNAVITGGGESALFAAANRA